MRFRTIGSEHRVTANLYGTMTRLAPRLAKAIAQAADKENHFALPRRRQRKSRYNPNITLKRPSFNAREYGRSILLSDAEINPITKSRAYDTVKMRPPVVTVPAGVRPREGELDVAREMTKQERQWWSSPYRKSFGVCCEDGPC